jgi:hypothetical protein
MPSTTPRPWDGDWLSALPTAANVFGRHSCPVCHGKMTARYGVAPTGEEFCDRHLGQTPCALCVMPAEASGLAIPLCRRCAVTSIRTSADVRRELPSVKHQLAALGIRTARPVKVQLASAELLRGIVGNHALGATVSSGTTVIDLFVLQDLPLLKFGTTVAHEVMHTYMTQNGFGEVPSLPSCRKAPAPQ